MTHIEETVTGDANGHTYTHRPRKNEDVIDSLAARQRALKIEALAHKKELEEQIDAMRREIAEIDEAFGFTGDEEEEKPKPARKPKPTMLRETYDPAEVSAKVMNVIGDYRTKGVSLATLAETIDAPKEAVEKAIKAAVKAGTVKAVGAARARKYHPADTDE